MDPHHACTHALRPLAPRRLCGPSWGGGRGGGGRVGSSMHAWRTHLPAGSLSPAVCGCSETPPFPHTSPTAPPGASLHAPPCLRPPAPPLTAHSLTLPVPAGRLLAALAEALTAARIKRDATDRTRGPPAPIVFGEAQLLLGMSQMAAGVALEQQARARGECCACICVHHRKDRWCASLIVCTAGVALETTQSTTSG